LIGTIKKRRKYEKTYLLIRNAEEFPFGVLAVSRPFIPHFFLAL
jgi:hypothetical protein